MRSVIITLSMIALAACAGRRDMSEAPAAEPAPEMAADAHADHLHQATIVSAEFNAIANQLALRPETAIDFTEVSGEYCFETGLAEGGHMTHFATDPTATREDVIDFVNAQSLSDAGVDLSALPLHPGTLGSMEPNVWYFLPAGALEPHHGVRFDMPLLLRASDLS